MVEIKTKILAPIISIIFALSAAVLSAGFAFAQTAEQINVSGYILNNENREISNDDYEIRFVIYSGDQNVWQENQTVAVENGIFNVYLGSVNSLPDSLNFNQGEYSLGVKIGDDSEMVPRRKIGAVPTAINSRYLQGETLGIKEGNILQLGKKGQVDIDRLPTGTKRNTLALGDDDRFHDQDTDTGTDSLEFNIGNNTALSGNNFDITVSEQTVKPALRFDGTTSAWQYSNDGSTFANIGFSSSLGIYLLLAGGTMTGDITFASTQTFGNTTLTELGYLNGVTGALYYAGGTDVATADGGLGADVTAAGAGEILYSTATTTYGHLAAGTSGQALISGGAGAPNWFAPIAGSVLFAGASGILSQDNSNFFWDSSTHMLGIGTATPNEALEVDGDFIQINGDYDDADVARGIKFWDDRYPYWGVYGAASGAGHSMDGDTAVAGAGGLTAHAIRFRVADAATTGFIFENDNEGLLASIRGDDGLAYFAGYVGISTATPATQLHVAGSTGITVGTHASTAGKLTLATSNAADTDPTLESDATGSVFLKAPTGWNNFNAQNHRFFNADGTSEWMRVQDGYVGIGTTNPAVKLEVNSTDQSLKVWSDLAVSSDTGRALQISANGESYARSIFYSNGAYGVGSGSATRDVFLTRSVANTFRIGSNYDGTGTGNLIINGNVGIGTTNPQYGLDVQNISAGRKVASFRYQSNDFPITLSTFDNSGQIGFNIYEASGQNYDITGYGGIINLDTSGNFHFQTALSGTGGTAATLTDRLTILNGGNVGIGTTSPSTGFSGSSTDVIVEIEGCDPTLVLDDTVGSHTDNFEIVNEGDIVRFLDGTDDVTIMTLGLTTNQGNVGIGTTNPSERLDVNGTNPRVYLADAVAPGTTTNRLYSVSGDLTWNGINLTGGGSLPAASEGYTLRGNGSAWQATDSLFVKSDGYVGIGTASPSQKLMVTGHVLIQGPDGYDAADEEAILYLGDTAHYFKTIYNSRDELMSYWGWDFNTHNGTQMTILQAGNVGIGTMAPSNKLSVTPTQYSTGTASQSLTTVTGVGTTFTSAMVGSQLVYADGTSGGTITAFGSATSLTVSTSQTVSSQAYDIAYTGLQVNSSGNVGIGTTNPGYVLDIHGAAADAAIRITAQNGDYDPYIIFANGAAVTTDDWSLGLDDTANDSFVISADQSLGTDTKLTITPTGNVGIGTTTPGSLLQIEGTTDPLILAEQTGAGNAILRLITSDNAGTGAIQFGDSGSVRIGRIVYNHTDNDLGFYTNDTEQVTILSTGNVGIGTTTPGRDLHVSGVTESNRYVLTGQDGGSSTGYWMYDDDDNWGTYLATAGAGKALDGGAAVAGHFGTGWAYRFRASINTGITQGFVFENGDNTLLMSIRGSDGEVYHPAKVGIGTMTPGNFKLNVEGQASFGTNGYVYTHYDSLNSDYNNDVDDGWLVLNYVGYQDGVTRFRDTAIADGKKNTIVFVDGSAGKVGIGTGTTTPTALLHLKDGGLHIDSDDGYDDLFLHSYGTNKADLYLYRAQGTAASPTVVLDGNTLGGIGWYGYDGANDESAAYIGAYVDGEPATAGDTTDMPGRLEFNTTPDGTDQPVTRMTIKNDGKVGIGTTSPEYILDINGTDALARMTREKDGAGDGAGFFFRRGHVGPAAVVENDTIFKLIGYGYINGDYRGMGRINMEVDGAVGVDDYPSRFVFKVVEDGSATESEVMRINNHGNVGIGTTSPGAKLDIQSTSIDENADGIRWGYDSDYYHSFSADFNPTAVNNNIGINVNSGTGTRGRVMTLLGTGNVGIGTMAPSNKLSVTPTQYSTGTASQSLTTVTGVGTTFTSAMVGSQLVYADGTSGGTITAFGSATSLTVSTSQTVSSQAYDIAYTGLQVNSSGNVGIGTTNPGRELHLVGEWELLRLQDTTTEHPGLEFNSGTAKHWNIWQNENGGNPRLEFYTENNDDSGGSCKVAINTSGNVGIGTTGPTSRLHVYNASGSGEITSEAGTNQDTGVRFRGDREWIIQNDGDASLGPADSLNIYDVTASASRLLIDTNGNVGIGTTTPSGPLHVISTSGEAYFDTFSDDANLKLDLQLRRARGSQASPAIVQSGDLLGDLRWHGYDGSNYPIATRIVASLDGTPGLNDMPGKLQFYTTPDGSTSDIARMTIKNDGKVGIGTTDPGMLFEVKDTSASLPGRIKLNSMNTTTGNTGEIWFSGLDSLNNETNYAAIASSIIDITDGSEDGDITFWTRRNGAWAKKMTLNPAGNLGIGTTVPGGGTGSHILTLVNSSAPTALASSTHLYSSAGEGYWMDDAGNAALQTPHDSETGKWIFFSTNVNTERTLKVEMEDLTKEIDKMLGGGYFFENGEGYQGENVIEEQGTVISEQGILISGLNLKTDQDITNLEELQTSIDGQLQQISNFQLSISNDFSILKGQTDEQAVLIEGLDLKVADNQLLIADLQEQMDLIQEQNDALMDFMLSLEAGKFVKADEDGNVDLLDGKLEAGEIVAGVFTVKIIDKEAPTIGEAFFCQEGYYNDENEKECREAVDENNDGKDDKSGEVIQDGQSVEIKTEAVSASAKIFTSFENNPGSSSWVEKVTDKESGDYTGFEILLSDPVSEEVKVNWWIVEKK